MIDFSGEPERIDRVTRAIWFFSIVLFGAVGVLYAVLGAWGPAVTEWCVTSAWLCFGFQRRIWFGNGYRRGRREMLAGLEEALQRGLGPREWLISEYERQYGFTIIGPSEEQL